MTVLVDSWAWIEYFKGMPAAQKAREIIESNEQMFVSAINVSEIYLFLLGNKPSEAEKLIKFVLNSSFVIPVETNLSLKAAKIKHEHKMGLADAIVMATAEENNAKILTGDDDFKNMQNVIYIGK